MQKFYLNLDIMKISEKQRAILACIDVDANTSLEAIQKQTGYRQHVIRYQIQQMKDKEIITPVAFIDVYPLGYTDYAMYFSISSKDKKTQQQLIQYLTSSPLISWFAGMGGDFQFGVAIYAKHFYEVTELLDNIAAKFGNILLNKSIKVIIEFIQFPRKYLGAQKKDIRPSYFGGTRNVVEIDETDHKILSVMANQSHNSVNEIAKLAGIPLSTAHYRIKQLEENKIITGYIYGIDTTKIGMLSYELLIYTKGLYQQLRDDMYDFAQHHKQIVHFLSCLGTWDFELGVHVEEAEDINGVVQELFEAFGDQIVSIKTLPLLRAYKTSYYPFI